MAELRGLVAAVLALPPRKAGADMRFLRDGQLRRVVVQDGEEQTTLALNDGYDLDTADHALVRSLESLLRVR